MNYETLRREIVRYIEPDDLVVILDISIEELVDLLALQIATKEDLFYFLDREEEDTDESE